VPDAAGVGGGVADAGGVGVGGGVPEAAGVGGGVGGFAGPASPTRPPNIFVNCVQLVTSTGVFIAGSVVGGVVIGGKVTIFTAPGLSGSFAGN
jgi:hypothetical protein